MTYIHTPQTRSSIQNALSIFIDYVATFTFHNVLGTIAQQRSVLSHWTP
jgi:hypothetical protein